MPGNSDYTAKNNLRWLTGGVAMPALPAVYLGLFTVAPADDGTGGTEVSAAGYARIQVGGTQVTNNTTAAGNPTIHIASVGAWVQPGMTVRNVTTPSSISAATTVLSVTANTVTMSANAAGAGIGNGDTLTFSAWPDAVASSGTEPATTPSNVTNGSIVTAPAAGANWGTVIFFGLFDALTSGNYLAGDYLGAFNWLPATVTLASPGVFTAHANGYSNGDPVVVTAKFGGFVPTGGSLAGVLTVGGATTDTFNVGVNTTSTGDVSVRKILQQSIPTGITASFAAGSLILYAA